MGHNHEGGNEDNDLLETQVVTITLDDDEEIESLLHLRLIQKNTLYFFH